ncbi:MAG: alpha-L-fucosidase, partial [Armatimonadota bacterium]
MIAIGIRVCGGPASGRPYQPNWESLKQNPIPEWVKDAKFGVYTHWGVYSVPAYETNTYCREMYAPKPGLTKRTVREHHERTYGPIEEFGYKDFVPMFTAPRFDAAEWVRVMTDAGAKFGGICLVHHDGFCLWDSEYTRWDSMDMGPKRDIYGEIAREVRKTDLRLLATFHHARTYGYHFTWAKLYTEEQRKSLDIFDPQYDDFYRNPETVSKEEFGAEWHSKAEEVIRKYQPDIIWFDGLTSSLRNGVINEKRLLEAFAHYYNTGTDYADDVVICNKLPAGKVWNFPPGFGLRCYENGRDMEPDPRGTWLIDRAISYPWTYVEGKTYNLTYQYHICSFVDLVSRGGIFLVSLTPKGDGSIPDEEKLIMGNIGEWLRVNGEGIYGTRPWKVVGEGTPVSEIRQVGEDGKARWEYRRIQESGRDVRFTRKGNVLYAFVIGEPERGRITIKSLARGNVEKSGKGIKSIAMLGSDEKLEWEQTAEALALHFPTRLPCEVAYGFRIEVDGELDDSPRPRPDDGIERVED